MTDTILPPQHSKPRRDPKCMFVKPSEFCRLAVSHQRLVRCDDPANGLRGLRDAETDVTYVVDAIELAHYRALSDPTMTNKPR
jgi:hypothetical protein